MSRVRSFRWPHADWLVLAAVAVLSLVMASACAENTPATKPVAATKPATTSSATLASPPDVAVGSEIASEGEYDAHEFFEVSYGGSDYICVRGPLAVASQIDCVLYFGGPGPTRYITTPDLYCSGGSAMPDCSELWYPSELDNYQLTTIDGQNMICSDANLGSSLGDLDCFAYDGGDPDLAASAFGFKYQCSRDGPTLTCAQDYYPSEMDDYELFTVDGRDVICTDAGYAGGYGDLDCFRYDGGDPSDAAFGLPDYKCSPSLPSLDCNSDYYPSEVEGLSIVSIDGGDYVCEETFQGQECYSWFGSGSPADAVGFVPDFYCNQFGCSPDDYP